MDHEHHHEHDGECHCHEHEHEHHREHENEHHHEHNGECHCHEHEHVHDHGEHAREGQGTRGSYCVNRSLHEGAVVTSAEFDFTAEDSTWERQLSAGMETLAAWVTAGGGLIGHIKAGISREQSSMLSITDCVLHNKKSPEETVRVRFAAIVFAVDGEELEERVEALVRPLCGCEE